MSSVFSIYGDDGQIDFSNQTSLMHLVKVCKPTFHSRQPWQLGGSYSSNQLQFTDSNRYYYELYYVDVPNGIMPICAVHNGCFVFIRNQKINNAIRMWFYSTPYEYAKPYLDLTQAIFYIYDLYSNVTHRINAGLKTWDREGNITFLSYSSPLEINHEVQFDYNQTSNFAFYVGSTGWGRQQPLLWNNHISPKRLLDNNRRYATILSNPVVSNTVNQGGSTEYYIESNTGLHGSVVAFFMIDMFSARTGLPKYTWQTTGRGATHFSGKSITKSPPVLCVDVTDLPTTFN